MQGTMDISSRVASRRQASRIPVHSSAVRIQLHPNGCACPPKPSPRCPCSASSAACQRLGGQSCLADASAASQALKAPALAQLGALPHASSHWLVHTGMQAHASTLTHSSSHCLPAACPGLPWAHSGPLSPNPNPKPNPKPNPAARKQPLPACCMPRHADPPLLPVHLPCRTHG